MSGLDKMEALELRKSPRRCTKLQYRGLSKRKTTKTWLKGLVKERGFKFSYFLTLSFYKPQRCIVNQYLDNEHIKKVIIDFFYPNKKTKQQDTVLIIRREA